MTIQQTLNLMEDVFFIFWAAVLLIGLVVYAIVHICSKIKAKNEEEDIYLIKLDELMDKVDYLMYVEDLNHRSPGGSKNNDSMQ